MLQWIAIIVGFAAFVVATIAIHELGHWLAGAMVGYELFTFRVIPFQWWRTAKGFRFTAKSVKPHSGFVVMVPRSFQALRWRHAVFVLGGPIVSMLLFAGLVVAFTKAGGFGDFRELDPHQETVARILGFAALIASGPAATLFVRSVTKDGHLSDGLQIYNLWKKPAEYQVSIAASSIVVPWTHLLRPSRWNPKAIEFLLQHVQDDKNLAGTHLAAFYHFLDAGQVEVAVKHIFLAAQHGLAAGDKLEANTRDMIFPEAAFCSALYVGNLEAAKQYLSAIDRPEMKEYAEYFRAEAAILWKQGETDQAREIVSWAYDKLIGGTPDPADEHVEFERNFLLQILETNPGVQSSVSSVPL